MKNITKLMGLMLFLATLIFTSCKKENDIWSPIPKGTNYAIAFNTDGGNAIAPINVEDGKTATKPTDPTKASFVFVGWYKDLILTTPFDFATEKITTNTTLYAKWATSAYAVTFEVNGGSAVAAVNAESGKTITKPTDPTKAGFVFEGWYSEADFKTAFNFTLQTITKDTTLYAKWKIAEFNLSFSDPLLKSTMPANITTSELKSSDVANPTKAGYTFVGWSETSDVYGAIISFPYTVKSNTTLYPQWVSAIEPTNINDLGSTVIINNVNTLATELVIIPATIGGKAVAEITGNSTAPSNTTIKKVKLPNSLTNIGDNAFKNCAALTDISIPSLVTNIGNRAFQSCSVLANITIPSLVTNIGDSAFQSCIALANITIPSLVTNIGNRAFSFCEKLDNVIIPSSVITIEEKAFWQCISLTSIAIPSSVNSIGIGTFDGCNKLTTATISATISTLESDMFSRCIALQTVTIPSTVQVIGNNAFLDCGVLASVTIPSAVTNIGNRAFMNCVTLTSVTIPSAVNTIGDEAFRGCTGLIDAVFKSTTVPASLGASIFTSGGHPSFKIKVPGASLGAYRTDLSGQKIDYQDANTLIIAE